MEENAPCPDCQWTIYLLTGRPVVFLRCNSCRNWFHCNVKVKPSSKSIVGDVTIVEASINPTCTKKMVNSILRCDCLARQTFLSHIAHCDGCKYQSSRMFAMFAPTPIRHDLRLLPKDTLHNFIVSLTKRVYRDSNLPAYTLQRRCGAVTEYMDRYFSELATEVQLPRALAYRQKRLEIRNANQK